MSLHRIWGVILRFIFHFRHSLDRLVDVFFWPIIDLVLWGLTGLYFVAMAPDAGRVTQAIVAGIIFWLVVYRGQYEVSGNLLEDLWNRNLVNMFVSPLTFAEWTTAFILLGIVKTIISFLFASGLAYMLYGVNVLSLGFAVPAFMVVLIITGWSAGFVIAGLILRYGTRIQAFAWTVVWVIAPFCGIYYPIAVLPPWAQSIAHVVPASYVFEGVREAVNSGTVDFRGILSGLFLAIGYFFLALWFLSRSFKAVLRRGLVKVY